MPSRCPLVSLDDAEYGFALSGLNSNVVPEPRVPLRSTLGYLLWPFQGQVFSA